MTIKTSRKYHSETSIYNMNAYKI